MSEPSILFLNDLQIVNTFAPERMAAVVFSKADALKELGVTRVNLRGAGVGNTVYLEALDADAMPIRSDSQTAALYAEIRMACFSFAPAIQSNLQVAPASEFAPCMCPERHDVRMSGAAMKKAVMAAKAFRCE